MKVRSSMLRHWRLSSTHTTIARSLQVVLPSRRLVTTHALSGPGWSTAVSTVRGPHHLRDSMNVNTTTGGSSCNTMSRQNHPALVIPFNQQVRWKGRNDGNKYRSEPRAPTKKQRKTYHRHLQAIQVEKDKHGAPGYKAGPRREWNQMIKDEMLQIDENEDDPQLSSPSYGVGDALLDDLMGNTVAAADTPEPAYFGHKHRRYFNAVADHMDDYRQYREQQQLLLKPNTDIATAKTTTSNDSDSQTSSDATPRLDPVVDLPPDDMLSRAVRAYRDRNGTRQRPVGLIAALTHVLTDMGVPIAAFGEYTYTTLLTCCRTPKEGRRLMQMMREQSPHVPVSAYSWSILVDIYAKTGDYQGCVDVHEEMLQAGVPPTLASYTSLLAACYKVCIDGRVSHAVRAEAGQVGWRKWQELRIVGTKQQPDVMAYGAILRLKAALGQPEVCINLLEEMQRFGVAPTTLCFTSALRAVARSHATAIRYEKGSSRRNRRREFITQHHGKLARHILIQAESASVVQDDGFVAALCLCAAAAGDVATAKSIYVASQIRRNDALRTIGSNEHLAQLRGETTEPNSALMLELEPVPQRRLEHDHFAHDRELSEYPDGTFNERDLVEQEEADNHRSVNASQKSYPSFGEREYGKDSRVLTAVLHACAQAADANGIGTMWQGRENKGYLCVNSLRLIATPKVPEYYDNSIPGQKITDNLTWAGEHTEGYREGKRKSRKFAGVDVDEEAGSTLDDLNETFSKMYLDDDGRLREEYRKTTYDEIWNLKYGENWNKSSETEVVRLGPTERDTRTDDSKRTNKSEVSNNESRADMFFDYDTMRWQSQSSEAANKPIAAPATLVAIENEKHDKGQGGPRATPDMFFDYETMRWNAIDATSADEKAPHTTNVMAAALSESDDSDSASDSDTDIVDKVSTDEVYFDDKERQWKTKHNVPPMHTGFESNHLSGHVEVYSEQRREDNESVETVTESDEEAFTLFYLDLRKEAIESGQDEVSEDEARELFAMMRDEYNEMIAKSPEELGLDHLVDLPSSTSFSTATTAAQVQVPTSTVPATFDYDEMLDESLDDSFDLTEFHPPSLESSFPGSAPLEIAGTDDEQYADALMDELRQMLPAFSDARLCKILRVFQKSLSDPPLLELIPIVRENLPDYITATWLKQMSALTAKFVVHKAMEDKVINVEFLNNVLELLASSGSIDRAIAFHDSEFDLHQVAPTSYSDRLVLQMLLKNNRFSRALAFKEKIGKSGRSMDVKAYGSMIEYCSRRGQLGSAVLLLRECLRDHGSPPGEATLSKLRLLYRQVQSVDVTELESMIGPDPLEWLRHGETNLKREKSKSGRRNVQMARNQLVRL